MGIKKHVFFIEDVPSNWIFEHYLSLTEKLIGQSIKILSVFKKERTPSMCIYLNEKNEYAFKDFSSSKGGNGVALVAELYGLTYANAAIKIKSDYENYINNEDVIIERIDVDIIPQSRYKVTDYKLRSWTNADAAYWTQFGISSDILNDYNVRPLEYYTMTREDSKGSKEEIKIIKPGIYGYFTNQNVLYKIYQPNQKNKKFIKVSSYIQGSDQIKHKKYLMICSSLKDAMTLVALKFNTIDVVAPDSENTMIPKEILQIYLESYDKVFTLLDDDVAGIKSMTRYEEEYGIKGIHLQMSKDLSDSVKEYGIKDVKIVLYNILKQLVK